MKKITLLICGVFLFQISLLSQNYSNFRSEKDFKEYFSQNLNKLDLIEGIWSYSVTIPGVLKNGGDYVAIDAFKTVIIKANNAYEVYSINKDGIRFSNTERFFKTSSDTRYIHEIYDKGVGGGKQFKSIINFTEENIFKSDFISDGVVARKDIYLKIFPDENIINEGNKNKYERTGTGFAFSPNGYIVTCNHVINDAKDIIVRAIKNNISYEYKATIAAVDKNNDLAILRIDDNSFHGFAEIPYTIKSNTSDVGTNIYILGYPLTSTMGKELKLTDGLISSKSGYQGDITSYQISAAAQPGSSGGPLFNEYGNLIGIVNAKHIDAENATYAIKSNYLLNLIESLQPSLTFQNANLLSGKSLVEQVNLVKDFVFMIEVN